ncbi:tail assembly protein [Haemophilus parahaemolyticus]|uniref:tail assembly protein n=1 Tax=Haemophilus parahaemolyticus TaxID=735 RepID=UPI0029108660|nr:tail assembly protein [Haemophilus parahaemolyticus]MDU4465538.1 tail assembly protein [Haemophilus parahaemolyticus]
MVTVRFYGTLKQFGTTFKLEVQNTAEALRALTSQIPHLRQFIQQGLFTVRIAQQYIDNRYLEKGLYYTLKENDVIHITPVLKGAKRGGVFGVITGVAMIATALVLSPLVLGAVAASTAWTIGAVGASLLLGGVAQMLTKQPNMPSVSEKEKKNSTAFSNLSNMASQGKPMPLAYGRIRTGSMIISQGVETFDAETAKLK